MKKAISCTLTGVGLLSWFLYTQNNQLVTTNFSCYFKHLPKAFDGLNIVHISDLHNKTFRKNQAPLIKKINQATPDVIFITGDIVDSRRYNEQPSLVLTKQLVDIAPVYYVTGNHEAKSENFELLEKNLRATGVQVLRNETAFLREQEQYLSITGIDDPSFAKDFPYSDDTLFMEQAIQLAEQAIQKQPDFRILLSHRPEKLALYAKHPFDLVFSGHAHGGQIRIPFLGGLIAPHQGFFPAYTAGLHKQNKTNLIVNRGLGNSMFPFRIFNRPEIVTMTLNRET